jgi:hypothetical protein
MLRSFALAILLMTAGCGVTDPFLYTEREFDRSAAGFGVEPADIAEVAICYSRLATSDVTVRQMAEERCGQFGKTARYRKVGWGDCPLATPTRAVFDCIAPGGG